MIDPSASIHRLAHVENATIGARTRVWQFASVIRNAKVGEDCNIATCAIVDASQVGDRCIVGHGAFLGPGMKIGNDVFIAPNVCFCNDFWPRVSKDGWFNTEDLCSGAIEVTRIDAGASIGANAVIMPGLKIGTGAMVAAGAIVVRDVPAWHLYKRDGSIVPIKDGVERKRYVIDEYDRKYMEAAVA